LDAVRARNTFDLLRPQDLLPLPGAALAEKTLRLFRLFLESFGVV